MDFFSFERTSLRLKEALGVQTDKDLAAQIGMEFSAFNMRKRRGSFPERELLALATERPDLGIDTHYVLTGKRLQDSVSEAIRGMPTRIREIRGAMDVAEFAAALGIGADQLAQIESGQRLPLPDLLKRLALMYPDNAGYLLTGERSKIEGQLSGREVVLIMNYRASSDEGRDALSYQANFFAEANAKSKHGRLNPLPATTPKRAGPPRALKSAAGPSVGTVHGQNIQGNLTTSAPQYFGVSPPSAAKKARKS